MDMDTDFEQDLAKVIDNQRAQTVFNRWKMRTTKDRAESSSSIGSITETAAEVQARFLLLSYESSVQFCKTTSDDGHLSIACLKGYD